MLVDSIQRWFKSICNCEISKFQQQIVTCLDNTTANITTVFPPDENNTAQAMINKIVNYMHGQNHDIAYLQSGWTVCLNADCEWKLDNITDNSTAAVEESDDDNNFIPQIVGLVVGILLCIIIGSFLCIFLVVRRIHKKSRLVNWCSYIGQLV